jgi:hypothetical protein
MDEVDLDEYGNDDGEDAPPAGPIGDLEFDDGNREEMAGHGVTADEVAEVARGRYVLLRNKREHRQQPYIMVGRTDAGRWLAIPISRSKRDRSRWRPATAFGATDGQITKAERALGGRT